MDGDTARFSFRDDPGPAGARRASSTPAEALQVCRRCTKASAATSRASSPATPLCGRLTASPIPSTGGAEQGRSSSPSSSSTASRPAYAIYRIKSGLAGRVSRSSQVKLVEAIATSPAAARELWRFIFGIDLVVRVQGRYDPGSPLFLMVGRPAQPPAAGLRGALAALRRPRSGARRTLVRRRRLASSSR